MFKLSKKILLAAMFSGYVCLSLLIYSCSSEDFPEGNAMDNSELGDYRLDEYVGAATCAECHAEAHAKWEESHHYHAMELPSPNCSCRF